MRTFSPFLFILLCLVTLSSCSSLDESKPSDAGFVSAVDFPQGEWVSIFNGKNLDGWVPKFSGEELGTNYLDTFQVEDGKLVVSYDNYSTLDGRFGHLFYKGVFSHYRLRLQYRFTGEQVPDAPNWALRNNGIMYHAQSPQSMWINQDFPMCVEVQLLGGLGEGERSTGNICAINTDMTIDGEVFKGKCINSKSKTFDGDQWVDIELEIRGSQRTLHKINGETVFDYTDIKYDDPYALAKFGNALNDYGVDSGYIALQAESHPTEFKNIEIMVLKP